MSDVIHFLHYLLTQTSQTELSNAHARAGLSIRHISDFVFGIIIVAIVKACHPVLIVAGETPSGIPIVSRIGSATVVVPAHGRRRRRSNNTSDELASTTSMMSVVFILLPVPLLLRLRRVAQGGMGGHQYIGTERPSVSNHVETFATLVSLLLLVLLLLLMMMMMSGEVRRRRR